VLNDDEFAAFITMACELQSQWASAATCQADGNIDGTVNVDDVLGVITFWSGDQEALSFFDLTGSDGPPDGMVNVEDLLLVIASWSGDTTCTPDVTYIGWSCLLEYVADCP
jgi:hypothetical protein